ncbi:hypothetical protein [Lujinxingia litoralis]|nr:hypothetical protein [Lujinxingia litoralis]
MESSCGNYADTGGQQKIGELVMGIDIIKEVHHMAKLDPFGSGWRSED